MKKTKLIAALAGLSAAVTVAGSCGEAAVTVTGNEGIEEFVRDYYSNEHLVLSESVSDKSQTLVWFVSDEEMLKTCMAITFKNKPNNQYEFIGTETVEKLSGDIWECFWHDGVSFYVNDQRCAEYTFSDNGNTMKAQLGEMPTSLFCNLSGADSDLHVTFNDKNGRRVFGN